MVRVHGADPAGMAGVPDFQDGAIKVRVDQAIPGSKERFRT
jgi:hypothetical protein